MLKTLFEHFNKLAEYSKLMEEEKENINSEEIDIQPRIFTVDSIGKRFVVSWPTNMMQIVYAWPANTLQVMYESIEQIAENHDVWKRETSVPIASEFKRNRVDESELKDLYRE